MIRIIILILIEATIPFFYFVDWSLKSENTSGVHLDLVWSVRLPNFADLTYLFFKIKKQKVFYKLKFIGNFLFQ